MHTCGIESKMLRNFDDNAGQYVRTRLSAFPTNIDPYLTHLPGSVTKFCKKICRKKLQKNPLKLCQASTTDVYYFFLLHCLRKVSLRNLFADQNKECASVYVFICSDHLF